MRISDWSSDVCSSDPGLHERMPLFREHVAVVVDDRVHADLRMTAEPLGDLAPAPPIAPPIWEFPMETRAPILVEDAFESCRQPDVATTGVHAPRTRHNTRRSGCLDDLVQQEIG